MKQQTIADIAKSLEHITPEDGIVDGAMHPDWEQINLKAAHRFAEVFDMRSPMSAAISEACKFRKALVHAHG